MLFPLATVFKVHRFLAGFSGLALFFAPRQVSKVFQPHRKVPEEEVFTTQSWGGFILAVAGIVHAAPGFPFAVQQTIGKVLAATFILESGLYAKQIVKCSKKEPSAGYTQSVGAVGSVFVSLALAYSIASIKPINP